MGPQSQSQRRIHLPPLGAIIALTLFCKNCSLQCLVKNFQLARESLSCHLASTEMVRQWSPTAACMVPSQAPVVCTLRVKGKANRPVGTAERDLGGWLAPGVVACQLLKRNQQDLGLIRPDFQRTQGQVQQHDKETATLACGIQHTHQQKVIEDSGRHLNMMEVRSYVELL